MEASTVRDFCLAFPGAWPDTPWSPDFEVVKIGTGRGRIFVYLGENGVSVKCGRNREEADEWLLRYPDQARVMPYDGRFGWNSLDYAIPGDELMDAIRESYRYAVAALPRAQRPDAHETV